MWQLKPLYRRKENTRICYRKIARIFENKVTQLNILRNSFAPVRNVLRCDFLIPKIYIVLWTIFIPDIPKQNRFETFDTRLESSRLWIANHPKITQEYSASETNLLYNFRIHPKFCTKIGQTKNEEAALTCVLETDKCLPTSADVLC